MKWQFAGRPTLSARLATLTREGAGPWLTGQGPALRGPDSVPQASRLTRMWVAVDSIEVAPCWPFPPMAGTGP